MPNVIDALNDFALPGRRLFPCDTPSLAQASAAAFDKEAAKLPAAEKMAAARHIVKRAGDHKIPVHNSLAARIAGNEINAWFKVALFTRKEACAWHPTAVRELQALAKVGEMITQQSPEVRQPLLDKLAEQIEAFDAKWDKNGSWRALDIPDAVDTVFTKSAAELGVVRVGTREIREHDLARLDKTAAAKTLSPGTLEAAKTIEAFGLADDVTRAALVAYIPERA